MKTHLEILRSHMQRAHGMLPFDVYENIHTAAASAGGSTFVEIGTAHGAATIALALGARTAGREAVIYSVDRLGGAFSSRSAFGSVDQNRAIVQGNFERAGVSQNIKLFVGTAEEFFLADTCPQSIDLLLLDADGRIDRDLNYFYSRMKPGTPIIIDDADENIHLRKTHDGTNYLDLKHRITNLLIAAYVKEGLLIQESMVGQTAFCRRGDRPHDRDQFAQVSLACYRELVFSELASNHWHELAAWGASRGEVRNAVRLWNSIPKVVLQPALRLRLAIKRMLFRKGHQPGN